MTSPLQQKLSAAQADQRSKSLDLREQAIAEQEKILRDSGLVEKSKRLRKQISIKEDTKKNLEVAIVNLEERFQKERSLIDERIALLNQAESAIRDDTRRLEAHKEDVAIAIGEAEKNLGEIVDALKDQKKYYNDQELAVNTAVAEWNDQLNGFHAEAQQLMEDKEKLLADILRLDQRADSVNQHIQELETKELVLDKTYTEKASLYKKELAIVKDDVAKAKQDILEWQLTQSAQEQEIATKLQTIDIKEASLVKRDIDLTMREKKLNMKLGLSGVSID